MNRVAAVCLCLLLAPVASAQDKRPIEIDDLFRFKRVSDPQISPDGKYVAYVVGTVDLEKNSSSSSIWVAPTEKGGEPRQLTQSPKKDTHPRWSPYSKHILFDSNRSGDGQFWIFKLNCVEPRQLTPLSTGASNGLWSRDGKHIAFVSGVWPEFSAKPFKESDALNKKRIDERAKSPVKARVFTHLFYRHWDEYV